MPPNGAKGSLTYPLTPIVPERTFLANEAPRSGSAVQTDPPSPYSLSLAIATASCPSAYGITPPPGRTTPPSPPSPLRPPPSITPTQLHPPPPPPPPLR